MSYHGQFKTDFHIEQYFPGKRNGICVDVGMGHPISGNHTYFFEQIGWDCLCIEPNTRYCEIAKGVRRQVVNVACGAVNVKKHPFSIFTLDNANEMAISGLSVDQRLVDSHKHLIRGHHTVEVDVSTLNDLLVPAIVGPIDFISIDTENTELDVLKGLDIPRWKPKLFVIENNFDEPMVGQYLARFGYQRDKRVGVNDFFVLTI